MVVQYYSKIVSVTKFLLEGTFWWSLHFGHLFHLWTVNMVAIELTFKHIMEKLVLLTPYMKSVHPSSNAKSPSEQG